IYNYAKTEVEQKSIITVKKYGNTATTSHYLALHEAMLDNTIVPGTRLMFLIGASGLIIGNSTYTVDDLPKRYKKAFGGGKK
ncbi:MAG: hypothetical protein GY754_31215, partial [bacterium]|nr:hypothetical protein [bacterium]